MSNSGPGYKKHAAHRVELKDGGARVEVLVDGKVIADTDDAVLVEETGHSPVYYVPRRHVKMAELARTEHETYCPFKGKASYFSMSDGRASPNLAWSYEHPYDEVMPLKERLAFYRDRVDEIRVTPS
jgi:uncharacterized protein (DUF427 family)